MRGQARHDLPGRERQDQREGAGQPPGGALYTGAKGALEARLGQPEDIARTVALLAGPGAAWITAYNLAADGGGLLP